jgi:uncharacterized glyoxalase superfamily protein PhnB
MNTKTFKQIVVPYFMVGNAPQFISFARAVFNAELISSQTRENSEDVIHAEIEIAGNRIFVADSGFCGGAWTSPSSRTGACSAPSDGAKPIQMFVCVDDTEESCRKAIAAGGSVAMEPHEDGGGRMCGIVDPFGNLWWLKSTN